MPKDRQPHREVTCDFHETCLQRDRKSLVLPGVSVPNARSGALSPLSRISCVSFSAAGNVSEFDDAGLRAYAALWVYAGLRGFTGYVGNADAINHLRLTYG